MTSDKGVINQWSSFLPYDSASRTLTMAYVLVKLQISMLVMRSRSKKSTEKSRGVLMTLHAVYDGIKVNAYRLMWSENWQWWSKGMFTVHKREKHISETTKHKKEQV